MSYKLPIVILILSLLFGCSSEERELIWINSYRVDCEGVSNQSCLQIQFGEFNEESWENFYNQIDGFNYVAGYIYQLKVFKTEIEDPPADGSSIHYSLESIVSKIQDERLRINDIWILTKLNGEVFETQQGGEIPQLEIHVRDRSVIGNVFCNTIRGNFTKLTDSEIQFGALASTRMICPDQELEYQYLQALGDTRRYIIQDLVLSFMDSINVEVLKYKKID